MVKKLIQRLTESHPQLGGILSNLGWHFVDRGLALLAALTVGVWMARYLGPENFGILSAGIAIAMLASTIGGFGLQKLVIKALIDQSGDSSGRILGSAAILNILVTALAVAVCLAIALAAPIEKSLSNILLILCLMVAAAPLHLLMCWFQSRLQDRANTLANNGALAIGSVFRIVLILSAAGVEWFAVALCVEVWLRGGLRWALYRKAGESESIGPWKPARGQMKDFAREAWPQALALVALTIYLRLDTVMLKAMAGNASAGIYSAAARISEVFYFIPAALGASLFPSIVSARKQDAALYWRRIDGFVKLHAALAYGIAITMTLAAYPLVTLLFGSSYAAAATVLMIHVWAALPFFMGAARAEYYAAEGLLRLNLPAALTGAVSNVGLNLLMIPLWRENGAALATLISYSLAWIVTSFLHRESRAFGWLQLKAMGNPIPNLRGLASNPEPVSTTGT